MKTLPKAILSVLLILTGSSRADHFVVTVDTVQYWWVETGSLTEALANAAATPGPDLITFAAGVNGATSYSNAPIPENVTIDGLKPGADPALAASKVRFVNSPIPTLSSGAALLNLSLDRPVDVAGSNVRIQNCEIDTRDYRGPNSSRKYACVNLIANEGASNIDIGGNRLLAETNGIVQAGGVISNLRIHGNTITVWPSERASLPNFPAPSLDELSPSAFPNTVFGGWVMGQVWGMNMDAGIQLTDATPNLILGGQADTATAHLGPNSITGFRTGVSITGTASGVDLSGNHFGFNRMDVDLRGDGLPELADAGDIDAGPNGGQNAPRVTSVTATAVTGSLASKASSTFEVVLTACRRPAHQAFVLRRFSVTGQRITLARQQVTTDSGGNASFSFPHAQNIDDVTFSLMAVAQDGSCSEFSEPFYPPYPVISPRLEDCEPGNFIQFNTCLGKVTEGGSFPLTFSRAGDLAAPSEIEVVVGRGAVGDELVVMNEPFSFPAERFFPYKGEPIRSIDPTGYFLTAPTFRVQFAAGETTKTISLPTRDNALHSKTVSFPVFMRNIVNAEPELAWDAYYFSLKDDEDPALFPKPAFKLPTRTIAEGDSGWHTVSIQACLTSAYSVPVTLSWMTFSAGTRPAETEVDYRSVASGRVTFLAGTTSQTLEVEVNGDTVMEAENGRMEQFGIRLTNDFGFVAESTISIADDDGRNLSIASQTVAEGNAGVKTVTVPVRLVLADSATPAPLGSDVTFRWNTPTVSGTGSIPAGQTETVISLQVGGDTLYELDEVISLQITEIVGAGILSTTAQGTVTVTNDDTPPVLSIENTVFTEHPDLVQGSAYFRVRLSKITGAPAVLNWATLGGTATAGVDFTSVSGTLRFEPGGVTSRWIPVPILIDHATEPDETILLYQTNVTGATMAPANAFTPATCTIKDMAVRAFFPNGNHLYVLRFPTGRGQSYLIESSPALGEGASWEPQSGLIAGSGADVNWLQYCEAEKCFFRVRVENTPPTP